MNSPLFILGMPRCRTAWLSLCLSSLGVSCTHEGMRDHVSWEAYADELDARLALGPAGDAAPGLEGWLDLILCRWPDARFIVVRREEHAGREAFLQSVPAEFRGSAGEGWEQVMWIFKNACDQLRREMHAARFVNLEDLGSDEVLLALVEFATGARPSALWAKRMQRLRVTSLVDPRECTVKPPAREIQPAALPSLEDVDTAGLSARLYESTDFELVNSWWQQHAGGLLAESMLPPLGVVVSDAHGPAAALWCYESYGAPMAELAYPVTRPGLAARRAVAALIYAVSASVAVAGKSYTPEARFTAFKTFAPKNMVSYLERLGFKQSFTERTAMVLHS